MDLEQTIVEAKSGSQKAFTILYNKYYKLIRYIIWNIVKNEDVADDLISVTFTKAFQKIDTFVNNISFEMWLKTIASNTAIDYIRRMKEEKSNDYLDDDLTFIQLESENLNPEQEIEKRERVMALDHAIQKLRTKYRQLLDLRYNQELSYREISETLGIPEGTVKSDLNKAKKKLKLFYKY